MPTIIDSEQEQFVKDLALSELEKLNDNMKDFIRKHTKDTFDKKQEEKQLLQEDKKNVKNK